MCGFKRPTKLTTVSVGYAFIANTSKPNHLTVKQSVQFMGRNLTDSTGSYIVIDTDYTNYALVYSCNQRIPNFLKTEIVWILARSKSLNSTQLDYLYGVMNSFGLSPSNFETTKQTCDN